MACFQLITTLIGAGIEPFHCLHFYELGGRKKGGASCHPFIIVCIVVVTCIGNRPLIAEKEANEEGGGVVANRNVTFCHCH